MTAPLNVAPDTSQHSCNIGLDGEDIRITAYGKPVTQGSKKGFLNKKTKRVTIVDDNKPALRTWRTIVHDAALAAMELTDPLAGPVQVRLVFCFDRPAGHWRTGRNAHLLKDAAATHPIAQNTTGDIDKLARSCLDSLTTAKVYGDDAQVVDLRARKVWAGDEGALHIPGVVITIRPVTS